MNTAARRLKAMLLLSLTGVGILYAQTAPRPDAWQTYAGDAQGRRFSRRVDGTIERLESGDPVLGLMPHLAFHARTMTLDRGDTLVAFSDGLVDAECDDGAEFGEERVIETLSAAASCGTADDILDAITAAHERFVHGAPPQDDITIVVARGV